MSWRVSMRRVAILSLMVALAAMIAAATAYASSPVTKSTGKDAAALIPTLAMFSNYDTYYFGLNSGYADSKQIPGASGKVNLIQPNGNVDVILAVSADGLNPNTQYTVWIDPAGNACGGGPCVTGPWLGPDMGPGTPQAQGSFTTDANGHGEWNFTAPAGTFPTGTYDYSVWINQANVDAGHGMGNFTVLVSGDVEFVIQ